MIPYFKERALSIALGLLSLIFVDILQLLIPRVIKRAVDELTILKVSLGTLALYALAIVGIAVMMGLFRYIWRRFLLGTSRRIEEGLRNQLFAHLQTLSASYFDKTSTGDLMAHATNDLQQIRMATGMGMVAINDTIFLGLATIGFMAYINVQLTFYVLIPMPCIVFGTLIFTRKMHSKYQEVQGKFSELTEVIRERFAGIRLIKAYNLQNHEKNQVNSFSRSYANDNLELAKIVGLFFPMMVFFTNLSMAAVLFFGGKQTILNTISPGDFAAFISYLGLLTWPMMAMGWVINLIQRGKASLGRIRTILETGPEISSPKDPASLPSGPVRISLKQVSFAYPSTGIVILKDISLDLEPGTLTGVIGPPGSGKTTLLNLIPRLYEPSQGCITLKGLNIAHLSLTELRSYISYVPQEPFLFSGTVRENITFGNSLFPEKDIEQAIEKAALELSKEEFPLGLETQVGEKGIILSGGQKQRIALARAFIHDKPVLLCDDPVSQVDTQTGKKIMDSISTLAENKTCLVGSHRLAALRTAQSILILEQGRIIDQGSHEDLLTSSSYYASTYYLQQIEEKIDDF